MTDLHTDDETPAGTSTSPRPVHGEERSANRLRIGVLIDGFAQPAWVLRVLEQIRDSGIAEVVLVIRNTADIYGERAPRRRGVARLVNLWRHRSSLPYTLYSRFDERRYGRPDDADRMLDATALLEGCPEIAVTPRMTKFSDFFADDVVEEIGRHRLDVALRFGFRILKGGALQIARYGVWSFHHGDNRVNRGGPAGFWEVMLGEPVTGAVLQVLSEELDAGLILGRSFSSTQRFSVSRNRSNYYWAAVPLVETSLRAVHARGQAVLDEARTAAQDWSAYSQRLFSAPTPAEVARSTSRLLVRLIASKFRSIGRTEQWFLAYRLAKPSAGRDGVPDGTAFRFKELVPPRDRFWADPMPVRVDDRYLIFFEEQLLAAPRAHICVLELDAKGEAGVPRRVLERPYHLSYPFVFRWNENWYMIPETLERRAVELYRATRFPDEWTLESVLLSDVAAVDATVAELDGRWWMFAGVLVPGATEVTQLHLYHAPNPLGPWTPHERNPVMSDVRGARPAGPLFRYHGAWYRPTQIGAPKYGSGIAMHRIEELTPSTFKEVVVDQMLPSWRAGLTGTHTIAAAGGLTVIDARHSIRSS